jgi:hypothetical protein
MSRKPSKPAKAAAKKASPAKAKKPAARPSKPAAKKAAKPEKPLPAKKAAAPAPKPKPAKAAAPRGGPPPKATKPTKAAAPKGKDAKGSASATKKKPAIAPTGIAKPGLGHKWSCFNCGAKFYDLGKPVPVCPKCEADQRDRPPMQPDSPPVAPQPKRPAMAPMSRFLDDDEVAAPEPDEFGTPAADAEVEDTEAAEIDIESLEEPSALGTETDFAEPEEE